MPAPAALSADDPAPQRLAAEARWRQGTVPRELDGAAVPDASVRLAGDQFILRTGTGYAFHYAPGEGVTVERTANADPAELELWLNGSVYSAIAAIQGFLPFHASAVAHAGRVYAISGPSGAGKSTLAAALGQHGLPLFCDDTLVLDVSDPARITCLPGHKRLKLATDAMALTGAQAGEPVGAAIAKRYAVPAGGTVRDVLPIGALLFIEDGVQTDIAPVAGAARIARLDDDHYTADFYARARGESLEQRFARLAAIAAQIPMHRLIRPRDAGCFADLVGHVASWIERDQRR